MGKKDFLYLGVMILILLAVYSPTLYYDLVFDSKYIFENHFLFKGHFSPFAAFAHAFAEEPYQPEVKNLYYRPVTTFSFLMEKKIWGLKNYQMRIVNLILFFTLLICLFRFLKLHSPDSDFPHIVTALFAFFPFQMDNIIWVIGRSDLLMLLFALLTLLYMNHFLKNGKVRDGILSCVFFTLGLYSKEAMLFIIPVLILYELNIHKRITFLYYLGLLIIGGSFFWIKGAVVGALGIPLAGYGSLLSDIKMLLSTLGYYLNTITMPYQYAIFIRPESTVNTLRLLSGIFFLVLMVVPVRWIYRKKELWFPYLLSILFIFAHLFLIFTPLSPYKASSRYLIFPILGMIWIAGYFTAKVRPIFKTIITLGLIATFIPSILINSTRYRNDIHFWKSFAHLDPGNPFYTDMLAQAYFDEQKYLEGEILLRQNLLHKKLKRKYLISHLTRLAYLESLRGNYRKSFHLLDSLKRVSRSGPENVNLEKIKIGAYLGTGQYQTAESHARELYEKYKTVPVYRALLNVYIAQIKWEQAETLHREMTLRFPLKRDLALGSIKSGYQAGNREEKIRFYIKYGNYREAVRLIKTRPLPDLKSRLRLLKLLYLSGLYSEANEQIRRILRSNNGESNYVTFNLIGSFYLNSLFRIEEAVQFFQKSLKLHPRQPQILEVVGFYNRYYK